MAGKEELGFNPEDYGDEDYSGDARLGLDIEKKAHELLEARDKRDEAKVALTTAENDYRQQEAEYFTAMSESKIKNAVKIDLGDHGDVTFGLGSTRYARILDSKKVREWAEANDERRAAFIDAEGKLVKARLNEEVRERLDNSTPLPPGLDFYVREYVTISQQVDEASASDPDAVE